MQLSNTSTLEDFKTTNFYSEMVTYLTTTALPHRKPFNNEQADDMMNQFYWISYWADNLEGIS